MRDRPSRFPHATAAVALAVLALPACSNRNYIQPGSYTAKVPPVAGAVLSIDPDKREVTFTLPGAAPLKRSSTAWDSAKWPTLCPRGMTDTASEILDLGPEPLQLGSTRVEHPLLVANCVGKPRVELWPLGADGRPVPPGAAMFDR
jgi:hypothetical protein